MKLADANVLLAETSFMDFSTANAGKLIVQYLKKFPEKFFVAKDIHAMLLKKLGPVTERQCMFVLNKLVSNKQIHSLRVMTKNVYRYAPITGELTIRDIRLSGLIEKIPMLYIIQLFLNEHNDSVFCSEELCTELVQWCKKNKIRPMIPSTKTVQRFPRIVIGKQGNLKAFYGSKTALDKFAQVCENAGRKYSRRNI